MIEILGTRAVQLIDCLGICKILSGSTIVQYNCVWIIDDNPVWQLPYQPQV